MPISDLELIVISLLLNPNWWYHIGCPGSCRIPFSWILMHPFDHPNADIILRSSNKEPVHLWVYKLLLSLASPFSSELFSLPQSSLPSVFNEYQDLGSLPIIKWRNTTSSFEPLIPCHCPNCAKRAREDLEAISLMLAVEIEKDISLVRF